MAYTGQSYVIGHYNEIVDEHYWIRDLLNLLQLQFNFTLGAIAAKYNIFGRLKDKCQHTKYLQYWVAFLLLALICFQCRVGTALYAFTFIMLVNLIKMPRILSLGLQKLGKMSMNIWLIHTWFCYYLFHDFIYGFRYPLLIYAVLLAISLLTSLIIDRICAPIERLIKDNAQPVI